MKARLAKDTLKPTFEVAVGHPAEQSLLYADRHGIDHIVVGHRGLSCSNDGCWALWRGK